VCFGQGCDDVFGISAGVLLQQCLDRVELVSDVFEFLVEVLAVVGNPVLDGFEQIPREVIVVAFGIAVLCDVFEPLREELLIGLRC